MAKTKAKGVTVKYGTAASPTDVLAQMAEVSFDQGARSPIDVTTHDSTTTKEYIDPGLRETASCEITVEYDPANAGHEAFRAAQSAGTLFYVTLVLPDAGAAQFAMSGYVTDCSLPTMTPSGSLKCTYSFKAASADTFTA